MQLVQEKAQKYNENGYKLASVICRQFLTLRGRAVIILSRYTQSALQKVGDYVSNDLKIIKAAIDDFKKIQKYMIIAKKENATETYAELKDEYLSLKAILQVAGVNITDIDKIKE